MLTIVAKRFLTKIFSEYIFLLKTDLRIEIVNNPLCVADVFVESSNDNSYSIKSTYTYRNIYRYIKKIYNIHG